LAPPKNRHLHYRQDASFALDARPHSSKHVDLDLPDTVCLHEVLAAVLDSYPDLREEFLEHLVEFGIAARWAGNPPRPTRVIWLA
jgi:hypothetical protein